MGKFRRTEGRLTSVDIGSDSMSETILIILTEKGPPTDLSELSLSITRCISSGVTSLKEKDLFADKDSMMRSMLGWFSSGSLSEFSGRLLSEVLRPRWEAIFTK